MSSRVLVIKREEIDPHVRMRDCIPLVESAFAAAAEGTAELPAKYHHDGEFGLWFFMGATWSPWGPWASSWAAPLRGMLPVR